MAHVKIPLRVLGEEQVGMLRRSLAGSEDILNPDVRHPLPKQVSHAGDEYPRRRLPLLRIVHGVGVIGGGKALGVRGGAHRLPVFVAELGRLLHVVAPGPLGQYLQRLNDGPLAGVRAKPGHHAPGVAVFAPVLTPRYRVPCVAAPLNVGLVNIHRSVISFP